MTGSITHHRGIESSRKEAILMNGTVPTLTSRNADFAQHSFVPGASMMPALKTIVIGCADPRVDPAHVLGLANGEALVIRNIGGRITPATLQTMATLRAIAQAEGAAPGPGWNLIVLQHTDCGITRLGGQPELLATTFGIDEADLPAKAVSDPRAAVAVDVAAIKDNPFLPADFIVSGLVYDVRTGLIETVVAPSLLRESTAA
jgi:carbonic anhydrase